MTHSTLRFSFRSRPAFVKSGALLATVFMLHGCSAIENARHAASDMRKKADESASGANIDPYADLTRGDFKKGLLPKRNIDPNQTVYFPGDKKHKTPAIAPMLVAPRPPSFGTDKLVTLSVTDDIPIRDVLVELAHSANVDLEVDPGITGGVIISVKDKPFSRVIERISQLAGLRYEYKDNVLRIERDMPYQINYSVDFLNLTRSGQSNININTQVLGAGGGDGLSGGSGNTITSSYEGDVWNSLSEGVRSILDFTPSQLISNDGGAAGSFSSNTSYNINKQAGVISVTASKQQHATLERYLAKVKESLSAQVLIEAKIVEVTLDDQYNTGVDWGTLADQNLGIQVSGNFSPTLGADSSSNVLRISGLSDLKAAVSMTEQFGTSRTLSSPRLHAMNNQQAILTFAENSVYFTIDVNEETNIGVDSTERSNLQVESQLNTVPIGVILLLQPSINLETQEVLMSVRPTLSRITGEVEDPAVALSIASFNSNNTGGDNSFASVQSLIPIIEVRELDSILKIKSGQVMVIGGLMREVATNTDKGVPYLSGVPFAGNLFKSVKRETEVVETIIFIKATIVPSQGVSSEDRRLYDRFVPHDPRPLTF